MSEPRPGSARALARGAALVVAVLGPLALIPGLALVAGRGLPVPLAWVAVPSTLLVLGALAWTLRAARRERRVRAAAALGLSGLAGLVAFTLGFVASPAPQAEATDAALPALTRTPGVAASRLETGSIARTAAFGVRGGSFDAPRRFAMDAILVTHPQGDVMIDTGFGADVDAHLAAMPLFFRLVTSLTHGVPAAAQLAAAGYDRARLRGILLTHAHWDHVSGAEDLDPVPLLVPESERAFVSDGWITAVARRVPLARYRTYAFEGGPALHASRSHDVYGDGAIVVVPTPGHTPGSVAVLVTESGGRRFLFLGDLVWQREGITEREERPWMTRLGDDDPIEVRRQIVAIDALARAHPELTLVPAHDARALRAVPRFRAR